MYGLQLLVIGLMLQNPWSVMFMRFDLATDSKSFRRLQIMVIVVHWFIHFAEETEKR